MQPVTHLYVHIPFCRHKCGYCDFNAYAGMDRLMPDYVDGLERELAGAREQHEFGRLQTVYLGGGTPSLLPAEELKKLFFAVRQEFKVLPKAEVTVECAPGTLTDEIIQALATHGVNRVSLGVQSFVDQEAASVARLHTREKTLSDIERLRKAGISNINVDLIAGLPHQTRESWDYSLEQAIATAVPHVSVYMLEVDEDSRLGRELIAGGTKYHAHFVPDDDLTADFYETACQRLNGAGVEQYEISNFARKGFKSRHNLKYWTRQPYVGFGVDAHSMLPAGEQHRAKKADAVRLWTTDDYDLFFQSPMWGNGLIDRQGAIEESFFLGLRLNSGVDWQELRERFGADLDPYCNAMDELLSEKLLEQSSGKIRLTARGRLLSNEVFQKFVLDRDPRKLGENSLFYRPIEAAREEI